MEVLRKRDSSENRATYTGRQDAQNILGMKLTSRVYDCFVDMLLLMLMLPPLL